MVQWRLKKRGMAGTATAALLLTVGFLAGVLPRAVFAEQAPLAPPAGQLICAGSGTSLPLIRVLAEQFHKRYPQIRIEVPASIGSTGGIRAAADGAIALGLVSRPLRENEAELGLTVRPYARTPLLLAVHPSVTERDISSAELLDIYRGTRNRWQNGRPIIVLTREPGDSTIEALIRGIAGFEQVYEESQRSSRWTTLLTDRKMNLTLAKTPDAFGLSDLGAVSIEKHAIRPMRINGVAPTLANLRSGAYPLFKVLSFVYREEHLSAAAGLFIDFVDSPEGAKLMRDNGYLPER